MSVLLACRPKSQGVEEDTHHCHNEVVEWEVWREGFGDVQFGVGGAGMFLDGSQRPSDGRVGASLGPQLAV